MSKYFQGKIEYTTQFDKDEKPSSKVVYIKGDNCRIEFSYMDFKSLSIYTLETDYSIEIEEQKIIDNGSVFEFKSEQIQLKELDENEVVLDYPCVAIEAKGKVEYDELEDEPDEINEKHFINSNFKINPSLKRISSLFLTGFLPLKIEYNITIENVNSITICEATYIEAVELPMKIFDVNSFENFEKLTYQEYEEQQDREWKEEEEKRAKEWADWQKKWAEEGKIITAKVAAFLETEFQRNLTPEEKENASQLFLDLIKTLSEEEASALSKRLLNSM